MRFNEVSDKLLDQLSYPKANGFLGVMEKLWLSIYRI